MVRILTMHEKNFANGMLKLKMSIASLSGFAKYFG